MIGNKWTSGEHDDFENIGVQKNGDEQHKKMSLCLVFPGQTSGKMVYEQTNARCLVDISIDGVLHQLILWEGPSPSSMFYFKPPVN